VVGGQHGRARELHHAMGGVEVARLVGGIDLKGGDIEWLIVAHPAGGLEHPHHVQGYGILSGGRADSEGCLEG
jgi:hypothetical protein